jgi:predicted RNase H-like HicB family nuclease
MDNRNYKYVVFTVEEDGTVEWVVKYPDLPGVIGSGDTEEEAINEAKGNKDFYLDYLKEKNRPFPPHTSSD